MEEKKENEEIIAIEEKKENTEITVVEENKNRKRRIILLLLLLMITGFLLTTSTYAWFTSNTTVSVNNIQVNVATQNGIQLSADGINWKSILSTTDLSGAYSTYSTATNQIPSSLEPVSTALTLENDYLKMYYGVVDTNSDGDYIITTSDVSTVLDNHATTEGTSAGTTGKFVMFDLFFKLDGTTGTETNIYMTSSSGVTADGTDSGIKNAARIAFINLGELTSSATSTQVQAISGGTSKYLWEPNYDVHTATGVNNAVQVYKMETTALTAGSGNAIVSYDGVNAVITSTDNIKLGDATAAKYASKFTTVTPAYKTTEAFNTSTESLQIFNLKAGYITKVRVYFWVEGQDVDCENGASGGNIILNLQFTTNAPSTSSSSTGN